MIREMLVDICEMLAGKLPVIAYMVIVFGICYAVGCKIKKKRIRMKLALLFMFFVNLFMFFPVYWEQSGLHSVLGSGIVYVMQIFGMGFKYDEFICAVNQAIDIKPHRIVMVILYVISPMFTGAFVLTLVADILKKFNFGFSFATDTYIFTELNENTLTLAGDYKGRAGDVVFLGVEDEKKVAFSEICSEKGYYIFDYTPEKAFRIADRKFFRFIRRRKGSISVFFADANEKKSIDKMMHFFKNIPEKQLQGNKAYLISVFSEAETLVDFYKKKVGMQLRLINPAQVISYKILDEYPLYAIPGRKFEDGYNVTVIGMGNVGMHIAKDVVWCGQRMNGGAPTVNMVDVRPKEDIRAEFEYKYPEINKENYNINYFSANAKSKTFDELLAGEIGNSECFIVCLGDDLTNAEVAREIRAKLYRYKRTYSQQIIAVIGDDEFSESMKAVCESLRIKLVGRNGELYTKSAIENDRLLYKAWLCDCAYKNKEFGDTGAFDEDAINFFREKELDIRSNMAYAIHIEYKIYDWLGMNPRTENAEKIEAEGMRRFKDGAQDIDRLEHNRWNAFQRAEGLVCPFAEEEMKDEVSFEAAVKKLKELTAKTYDERIDYEKPKDKKNPSDTKPQRSIFSKEHGCIIDYKWIEMLGEYMANNHDKYKRADRDINRRMFEIRKR